MVRILCVAASKTQMCPRAFWYHVKSRAHALLVSVHTRVRKNQEQSSSNSAVRQRPAWARNSDRLRENETAVEQQSNVWGSALWIPVESRRHDFAHSIFVSLLCGHAGPVSILCVVLLDAEAHVVEVSKLELRPGAALLRSSAIPFCGMGIVARYALAKVVKVSEPLLRVRKSLRRCQSIPVRGFGILAAFMKQSGRSPRTRVPRTRGRYIWIAAQAMENDYALVNRQPQGF